MIEARGLSKVFGTAWALRELDLIVQPGELVALLGANGAGKTTTINLFLGFLEPSTGVALVNGQNVREAPLATKRELAYIPEQVSLYPLLTGLENLEFFTALAGHSGYTRAELRAFLERAGLASADVDRRAGTYSKGMRQKVGIAAAMAKRATTFLLDEPLSGLDPKAANEFSTTLRTLKHEGIAILMATHDIFRAKEVASRIGIMKAGRLVDEVDPGSLGHAELESVYLEHMRDEASAPAARAS